VRKIGLSVEVSDKRQIAAIHASLCSHMQ